MQNMFMLLYDIGSALALLTLFPFELMKRPAGNRLEWARDKCSLSSVVPHDVWIHAVSVGEALVAAGLVRELRLRHPDLSVAVSTVTDTGRAIAKKEIPGATVFYLPWDIRPITGRLMRRLRPRVLVTMETELWPALIGSARKRNIPVLILNGRISDRSYRGYMRIRSFMKEILTKVSYFGMQSEMDMNRIVAMGAPRESAGITGNIKYDIEIPSRVDIEWMDSLERPILLAGSTHEGEEEKLIEAYGIIRERGMNLTLVIAPRHPERFDRVIGIVRDKGLECTRRSEIKSNLSGSATKGVVILDSMGELAASYCGADVAFVGGSLVPLGGHNILEPAMWKKPILFGPHMNNFRQISGDFLSESACIQVSDAGDLARWVLRLLSDTRFAADMAGRARDILDRNRGAARRCADVLEGYLQ